MELGLHGVHLGYEDSQGADLKAIRKHGLRLGLSTHCQEELDWALQADPYYVALGPIFPTTLKKMRFEPQGIPRISLWRQQIPPSILLVAIGGIAWEQREALFQAGADVLSVVSDVTQNPQPECRVRQWLEHR